MSSSFQLAKSSVPCACGDSMVFVRRGKTQAAGEVNCCGCGVLRQKLVGEPLKQMINRRRS